MHVLLTNDDGPPNDVSSPYIRFFVDAIAKYTDWDLSIVLPDAQRSWISKAHFAGKELTASFIYPNENSNSFNGPFPLPNETYRKQRDLKEWALVDGTPASCTDIGIYHLYKEKGPVNLVISGPNVGKNSTAAYILSSGTLGAAMEGAIHNKKAIGLSYGYITKDTEESILIKAAEISVKLIDYLYKNWNSEVDLYSINVPLVSTILEKGNTKVLYAPILHNRWISIFKEEEVDPTRTNDSGNENTDIIDITTKNAIQYKWAPDFDYIHKGIQATDFLNDGKVITDGNISVTPLKACYSDMKEIQGEIGLDI